MNQLIGQKKINKKTYFRLRWFDLVCCGKIVVNERAERENKFGSFCIYLGRDRNDQFQQFHLCFYIVTRYYQINLNYMYIHENYDIALAMSSSHADPVLGHCPGWGYLNI